MLTVTQADQPAFQARSQTSQDSPLSNSNTHAKTTPNVAPDTTPMPKTLNSRQVGSSSSDAEN